MTNNQSDTTLFFESIKPLLDAGKNIEEIAEQIGMEESKVSEVVMKFLKPYSQRDGPALFHRLKETIAHHYYFEEEWHLTIVALFVLQAKCAKALPAVFYLYFGGVKGSGKSNILDLLCSLCDGVKCENISVPALARSMSAGKAVFIDEIDADRGKDGNEIRDALLRQGYKASAAPYTRYDLTKRAVDQVEIFGPKAATYRGDLSDDALKDRGFQISTVKVEGEDGYGYVLSNLWPKVGDLPKELDEWGENAIAAFTSDKLEEIARSKSFIQKVKKVVAQLDANRESELVTIALLVAETAGIEVAEELHSAVRTREATYEGVTDDLEELSDVILQLAPSKRVRTIDGMEFVTLKQSEVKREINARRNQRNDRALSDKRFAVLRRELGIGDKYLVKPGGAMFWRLPDKFIDDLANKANLAHNDEMPDWEVGGVDQVGRVRQLREDAKVMPHEDLVAKYGVELVEREKIPKFGGRP